MIGFIGTSITITINYNSSQSVTLLRLAPFLNGLRMSSFPIVTDLVLVYESVTSSASVIRWLTLHSWTLNFWILVRLNRSKVTLRLTVSQSVSYGVEPNLGLMTRYLLLFDSYGLIFVGCPRWREEGSVFRISCWFLTARSFSDPSHFGLANIFYCFTFETSLFVTSYDSQGHGGGIRPHLHTSDLNRSLLHSFI
jgi:hypothetical protein